MEIEGLTACCLCQNGDADHIGLVTFSEPESTMVGLTGDDGYEYGLCRGCFAAMRHLPPDVSLRTIQLTIAGGLSAESSWN